MNISCPLTFRLIDGTISRLNALFILLLLVVFLASGAIAPLYIIAFDFMLRLYAPDHFSPLTQLSKAIQKLFRLPAVMTDAGAKRVAAFMGLGMVLGLIAVAHLKVTGLVYAISAIFILCTAMEFSLSFCIGCYLYHLYHKLIVR